MEVFDEIASLVARRGRKPYLGEPVTQEQHMLQAATLALRDEAPATLVTAALLHDIGHLLQDVDDGEFDDTHEFLAEQWLVQYFPRAVTEPVRLHVDAKRYLCTVEPSYLAQLSPTSRHTLHLQGGLMSEEEREYFEENRYVMAAIRLRRYDDLAKRPGARTPHLQAFRPYVEASLVRLPLPVN